METPEEFCTRVPRELGLVDFNSFEARRHLEMRVAERDNAVRLALLDELIALDDGSEGTLSVDQAVAMLRLKYRPPRGKL